MLCLHLQHIHKNSAATNPFHTSAFSMAAFAGAKDFLAQQHLAPLLSQVQQNLVSLNKWDTVGKALQASAQGVVGLVSQARVLTANQMCLIE